MLRRAMWVARVLVLGPRAATWRAGIAAFFAVPGARNGRPDTVRDHRRLSGPRGGFQKVVIRNGRLSEQSLRNDRSELVIVRE